MNAQRVAAKRLSLLPTRVMAGPRNGVLRSPAQQQAGDLFWKCGVECFKPVYARIDARFPLPTRVNDPEMKKKHSDLMDEAKRILQEHRNLIVEAVLPMFTVRLRKKDEASSEADVHAHDYFFSNLCAQMTDTLIAHLPLFCEKEDVEPMTQAVSNLAKVQGDRLTSQLLNFSFGFRRVITEEQAAEKGRY